jgi:hypothetical protein
VSIADLDLFEKRSEQVMRKSIRSLNPLHCPASDFYYLLLQRKEISHEFTGTYDTILSAISSRTTAPVPVIRRIIREEYPDSSPLPKGDLPSHREDLRTDLLAIGISECDFIKSEASDQTVESICQIRNIIKELKSLEYPDISLVAFLRFWGEVLTAAEYSELWPRIQQLLGSTKSNFYAPHIDHDERRMCLIDVDTDTRHAGHSDELAVALMSSLPQSRAERNVAIKCVMRATKLAIDHKVNFYAQFA